VSPGVAPDAPSAAFALPWDDPDAPDPVAALTAARRELGDRFVVRSGSTTYLFVFDREGLDAFYKVTERDASKGLADYRMLVRKLPLELFAERRTFPHDLFGAHDVENYLDNLDWAITVQLAELGVAGTFDTFDLARRVGHRLALTCWMGREISVDELIPEFDILDGAEAFVHPARMTNQTYDAERAALRRVEVAVGKLLANEARSPSFLDDIASRWSDADDPVPGIAGDVVILHVATMTNLFAALAWTLALTLLHPSEAPLEQCALEAVRLGQRSIMLREVLKPLAFCGYEVEPGVQLATMLPVTNMASNGGDFVPERWADRALHQDVAVTTFGHGSHRCPAQRFSVSAIVRTVSALRDAYELAPLYDAVIPEPGQIGGVGRAAHPTPVRYERHSGG
jgi:cytochrome P450